MKEQLIKSGWRDSLKAECRRVVQEQGLDNINADEIIKQVTPQARGMTVNPVSLCNTFSKSNTLFSFTATIPNDVKQDLLQKIRDIVQAESESL